ncbi:hypothetical protein HK405_013352, partial [Cladochytrium tenue]
TISLDDDEGAEDEGVMTSFDEAFESPAKDSQPSDLIETSAKGEEEESYQMEPMDVVETQDVQEFSECQTFVDIKKEATIDASVSMYILTVSERVRPNVIAHGTTANHAEDAFAALQRQRNVQVVMSQLRTIHSSADQESRQLSKEWEIWVPALTAKNKMEAARREGALVRQEVAKQKATLDKLVNTLEDTSLETADMRVQQAAQVTRAEKLQELQENLTAAETQRNKLQEIYVWLKECERKGELGPIAAAKRSKLEEINERLAEDTPLQKLGAYESVLHYFGVMKWLFEVDKEYQDAARGWNELKRYQKIVEGYETQVAKLDL